MSERWYYVPIFWKLVPSLMIGVGLLAGVCVAKPKYRFPRDPYVLYTPTPRPNQIWYCEKKSWGGSVCHALDSYELARKSAENSASLVCAEEKGFTKTCWRAQDVDDHGAYSY